MGTQHAALTERAVSERHVASTLDVRLEVSDTRPSGAGRMGREVAAALRMALVTLVLTGLIYPFGVTALAHLVWARQAAGSLLTVDGHVVGSQLIGQTFKSAAYFQGRPSAAGPVGYDATASSGSNYGPTSRKLRDRVVADLRRLRAENPEASPAVPIELVTASGSGLDPDVSPEAARWQIPRVAAARGVPPAAVRALVDAHVEGRTWGFLGEPRVNVLLLNLDADRRFGKPAGRGRPAP